MVLHIYVTSVTLGRAAGLLAEVPEVNTAIKTSCKAGNKWLKYQRFRTGAQGLLKVQLEVSFSMNSFKKKKKKIYFCVTSLVNAVITGGFIHKTDARLLRAEQELLGFLHLQSHCGGIKQPVQSTPSQPAS